MKSNLVLSLLISASNFSAWTVAHADSGSLVERLTPKFEMTMKTCPERIWSGYSWRSTNILIIESEQKVTLWDGSTGKTALVPATSVSPNAFYGLYDFTPHQGRQTVTGNWMNAVESNIPESEFFKVLVHEGFHAFAQNTWVSREGGKRGTQYPQKHEPRLARSMMFDRLKQYFLSSGLDKTALQKASYWHQEWLKSAPHEVRQTTDGFEGTARYVDTMATVIAELGCSATDEQVVAGLKQILQSRFGWSLAGHRFSLDSEGYDVGAVTAMILQFIEKNTSWQNEVAAGKPLTSLLLDKVPALPETADTEKEAVFKQTEISSNQMIGELVEPDLKNIESKDYVRVVPHRDSAPSTFSPMFFVLPESHPTVSLTPMAMEMNFSRGSWTLKTLPEQVFLDDDKAPAPCREGYYYWLLVPRQAVAERNGVYSVSTEKISGQIQAKEVTDVRGHTWLCGE